MPDLRRLVDRSEPAPILVEAVVETAPATLDDELTVVIPSADRDRVLEIRRWMPRGDVLPAAGDTALLAYSDTDEPWLVAFTPS